MSMSGRSGRVLERVGAKGRVAAATIAVVSLLAGCGSSHSTSSPPTSGGSAGSLTKAPLVIGFQCSCSGSLAASNYYAAPEAKAWESYINNSGGIDGHPVHVIISDDTLNPTTATTQVERLVSSDHVIAVADASDLSSLWGASVVAANIPIIGAIPGSALEFSTPDAFPVGLTGDVLPESVAEEAVLIGAKKIADFYCVESPVCAQTESLLGKTTASYGLQLVYHASISVSQPSFAADCLAAKAAGAQAFLIASAGPAIQAFVRECNLEGYHPTIIQEELSLPVYASVPGMEGAIFEQPVIPIIIKNNPELNLMYSVLQKYAPTVTTNPEFSDAVVLEWGALQLIALGAKAANFGATPTAAELKAGLYSLHNESIGGLQDPTTYSSTSPTTIHCFYEMRISHGQYVAPIGTKRICIDNPTVLEPPIKL